MAIHCTVHRYQVSCWLFITYIHVYFPVFHILFSFYWVQEYVWIIVIFLQFMHFLVFTHCRKMVLLFTIVTMFTKSWALTWFMFIPTFSTFLFYCRSSRFIVCIFHWLAFHLLWITFICWVEVSAARQISIAFCRDNYVSRNNLLRTESFITPQTSLSLMRESVKSPNSHDFDKILSSVTYESIDSPSFWFRVLNWCLS